LLSSIVKFDCTCPDYMLLLLVHIQKWHIVT
jgi:hypothetical protein